MKKYRIRLHSERVVGPFEIEQIKELKEKGRIQGDEQVQIYPTGDWKSFDSFDELNEIKNIQSVQDDEATFVKKINLSELLDEQPVEDEVEESFPKKFEYEKKTPFADRAVQVELTKTNTIQKEIEENNEASKKEDELTKTVSNDKNEQSSSNEDKTVINTNTLDYLKKLKEDKEKEEKEKEEALKQEKENPPEPEIDLDNDSTQFIDLASFKSNLELETKSAEKEFKKEEKEFKKEKKKLEKKKLEAEELDDEYEDDDEDEEKSKKKKKIIILVAVFLLAYVLLFPEEEAAKRAEKVTIKSPKISFPVRFDKPDENISQELYRKGLELQRKGTHVSDILAATAYKKSLENKFNGNPAAAKLIFLYSHLLDTSKNRIEDTNTIFKLVQIFKNKMLLDSNFAAAGAYFYYQTKKYAASVNAVEKYNAIKKSNPTVELFAVYLKSLLKTGDLIKAKAVARKIETVPMKNRSIFVIMSLIEYYKVLGDNEAISKIIVKAREVYKRSVPLNLERARLLFYQDDLKGMDKLLKQLRTINLGGSKVDYANYLELKGLYFVKTGKLDKAERAFKKALETNETIELRSRLASLYDSEDSEQNSLVTESKALQLIASSKLQLNKSNWKFAFRDALEATRIAPNFIPAKINLAKLQIKQSLFKEALQSLEALYQENSSNPEIVFTLIDAYIESYKFTDVKRLLTVLNTSTLRNDPQYTTLTAKYYIYKNDFRSAESWLTKAINKNPLNDNNLEELAKMYIKYNRFKKAKLTLNKAMDLDPSKVEYRIFFSNILYESETADTAIGYLYNVLSDFPDNPKLLSQIGILYYRSGQIKFFENIKKKLTTIPNKDTTLYEFLIEAAKLDDKPLDQIKYSKKLIELNPGDLAVRIRLGKLYMEMDKYKEALVEFKAIEDRLDTYPDLQLYMSNLYLLTGNTEKAAELAMKEIKANSANELGYILLGDIYSKDKEYIKAEKEYKKAQKINGDNVDMLLGLAKINFKKSQYDLALDLFLRARENSPDRAEIHKLLGDAYRKIGQSSLATESYKLFLELSPTSKYKDEINTYIRTMQ